MFIISRKWLFVILILSRTDAVNASDPSALWKIVDGQCVPHMRDARDPSPCAIADLNAGYVVLKDLVGVAQFLLIPTIRIAGIETRELLADGAPNYCDLAWRARGLVQSRLGKSLPRDAMSLTVNSPYGRTQNQLHIHIDCVRPDVRDALAAHKDAITPVWSTFPALLAGFSWRVIRVDGENLGSANPFRLLAAGDPGAAADMGRHTLAVVGMTWSDVGAGFAVLDGKADLLTLNRGSAEVLQDHDCVIAQ